MCIENNNRTIHVPGIGEFNVGDAEPSFSGFTGFRLTALNPDIHDQLIIEGWGTDIHSENGWCYLVPVRMYMFRQWIGPLAQLPHDTVEMSDEEYSKPEGIRQHLMVLCEKLQARYFEYRWRYAAHELPEELFIQVVVPQQAYTDLDQWIEHFRRTLGQVQDEQINA